MFNHFFRPIFGYREDLNYYFQIFLVLAFTLAMNYTSFQMRAKRNDVARQEYFGAPASEGSAPAEPKLTRARRREEERRVGEGERGQDAGRHQAAPGHHAGAGGRGDGQVSAAM
jgi:hypothetical protein